MLSKLFKQIVQKPFIRMLSTEHRVLTEASIGNNVKNSEYAVRGEINIKGAELQEQMNNGDNMMFDKFYPCNIGNPLLLGQPPLSFNREVHSIYIIYTYCIYIYIYYIYTNSKFKLSVGNLSMRKSRANGEHVHPPRCKT